MEEETYRFFDNTNKPRRNEQVHQLLSLGRKCYAFSRTSKDGTLVYQCSGDGCHVLVKIDNTTKKSTVEGVHTCALDHEKLFRARCRREILTRELNLEKTQNPRILVNKIILQPDCDQASKKEIEACTKFASRLQDRLLGSGNEIYQNAKISDCLKLTIEPKSEVNENNNFLYYDSIDEDPNMPRIIIFSSAHQQHIAFHSKEIFADGTCWITPSDVNCVYTIHSLVEDHVFPVVFFLLPNEKTDTFTFAFSKISTFFPSLLVAHTDCQIAAMSAFRSVFKCEIKICLFHLNQAVYRMLGKVGLSTQYQINSVLHTWVRRLFSIPFLPQSEIKSTFEKFFEEMSLSEQYGVPENIKTKFQELLIYYKRFWLEKIDCSNWCQFCEQNRTNNFSEGFHSGVGYLITVAHPKLFVLIDFLRKIENKTKKEWGNLI
ncbi:hypothetical protein EIN_484730 [Entamoeba invadens IP1]|uniref:Uncharacterized protein n=1 Tax=Entamoeba invadens IP1 TaxID=370355 RepID=A0A0A1U4F0_ENTIV|nr:hypothetical protein EIN_484730 [Entamoeba invadens IP1]ELP89131.1 hypothetical protein EIN_484730 [Entamoeba invadens IP1]|eukprot:XP_004255902.1 hypothetical protein EIN_484730 [Entamoeba invadens IP1]